MACEFIEKCILKKTKYCFDDVREYCGHYKKLKKEMEETELKK